MGKKLDRVLARLRRLFSDNDAGDVKSLASTMEPNSHASAIDVRSKCGHFRILVIGRANAGKTTLLRKVCMSIEDPEIFGPDGEKIDFNVVEGSTDRGLHDIENQLVFKSNRQFIFHDSRGFESGSMEETNKVKDFIAQRAASSTLETQLHAIWYCLPTSDTNRPLLKADEDFFDTNIRGKLPVIAIFTKFDGLATRAFQELKDDDGYSRSEAQRRKVQRAEQLLTTDFIEPLKSRKVPPSDYLHLAHMDEDMTNCNELVEKTAKALTDDNLRILFVSVQQNNVDLSIKYAVRFGVQIGRIGTIIDIVRDVLGWFPHVWRPEEYDDSSIRQQGIDIMIDRRRFFRRGGEQFSKNVAHCIAVLKAKYPNLEKKFGNLPGQAEFVTAICICTEQTFSQASAHKESFGSAFSTAINAYLASSMKEVVNSAIAALPAEDYTEEVEDPDYGDFVPKVVPKLLDIIKTHRLRI